MLVKCIYCKQEFTPNVTQIKESTWGCSKCRYQKFQKQRQVSYLAENPWWKPLKRLRERCNNPHNNCYFRYGGRGIKALLTVEEIKTLWIRDHAWTLKKPSIDRINPDGHYEYSNCRFIELSQNCSEVRRWR